MTYLRRVLAPGLVVVLACAVVAGFLAGSTAALSALGGGLAVVLLLASTPAVLGPVATTMPGFSLAAAVTFYLTKIAVLAVALVVLTSDAMRAAVDREALGISAIVVTLAWTILLVVAALRNRQPLYDLPAGNGRSPDSLDVP